MVDEAAQVVQRLQRPAVQQGGGAAGQEAGGGVDGRAPPVGVGGEARVEAVDAGVRRGRVVGQSVEGHEPGLQGDRSTGGTKPARLETGHEIAVPLFITTGEKVKVDTRDGSYLGRVTGG